MTEQQRCGALNSEHASRCDWRTLLGGQTFILRVDYVVNIIAVCFVGMQFLLSLGQAAGLSRSP